jgi:hypothetical protein
MKRMAWVGGLILLVVGPWSAMATPLSVGLGVGYDPTGIFLINVLTEQALQENLDVRVEVGLATGNIVGLMVLSGNLLLHQPLLVLDPFAGAGLGLAVTRVPSVGVTLEGILGTRIVPSMPFGAYAEVRYILRLSTTGFSAGPVYEAGLFVSF